MKLYNEELKDFLMSEETEKQDELNAKLLAATRSEKAKVIQTLAHLNVSDELLGLGVIYLSKTHGLQVTLSSGALEPICIGAAQLQKMTLERIFTQPEQPTNKDKMQ